MDLAHHGPLLLSLLALGVGPLIYHLARAAGHMLAALDGFVYVAIGGLVLLHIMPETFALAGWAALVGGLVGLVLPSLAEHRLGGRAQQVHNVALVLGLAAIGLHAFLDGLALVTGSHGEPDAGHMLPMAVILHRVPVGLTIWFLLRPLYGRGTAAAVLALIAAATTVGFAAGEPLQAAMESRARGVFQALVAGSLLHVVVHRSYPVSGSAGAPGWRWQSGLGAAGGIALLAAITTSHTVGPALRDAGQVFVQLARESAPALVLAYAGAGLIHTFLPRASLAWMGRGSPLSQAARGVAFGLPLPICSCGIVPVYRSLVGQGVPIAAAMAFMIATPEMSLDAVLISVPLLGGGFAAVRVAAAAAVALLVGWLLGRSARVLVSAGDAEGDSTAAPGGVWKGLRQAAASGFGGVVDDTAPWILVGLGMASLVHPLFQAEWLKLLPRGTEVAVFALLGMPTYVCASGATPLVAVLIGKGVSPGAALAFLLTGPATNITTFGVLARLHGRRLALAFGAGIAALSVALGLLVNALWPDLAAAARQREMGVGDWGPETVAVAVVGAAFALSLLRRGPRAFVGELFEAGDNDDSCQTGEHDARDHAHGGSASGCADAADGPAH
ncbi:MAG: permease [Gemmatimonadota bacterium]